MTIILAYAQSFGRLGTAPSNGIHLYSDHLFHELRKTYVSEEIIYTDFTNFKKFRGKRSISGLFTLSGHFNDWVRATRPQNTCLISVNEHALMRRQIRNVAKKNRIPRRLIDPHDGLQSNLKETRWADFVLGIGGWPVLQSYVRAGTPLRKVFVTSYPYWSENFPPISNKEIRGKILFFPGYLTLRKGLDYIPSLASFLKRSFPGFKLVIQGFDGKAEWAKQIAEWVDMFPKNLEIRSGKIDYGSMSWLAWRDEFDLALFPTYEEGLAGCALDVLNLGIPLIHSSKTGVEYAHELIQEVDFENRDWETGLARILSGGPILWSEIAIRQRQMAFHLQPQFSGTGNAIRRMSLGQVWPNFDAPNDVSLAKQALGLKETSPIEYVLETSTKAPALEATYLSHKANFLDLIALALLLLEKYTAFDSLKLKTSETIDIHLQLRRRQQNCVQTKIPENGSIFIREYIYSNSNTKQKAKALLLREISHSIIEFPSRKIRRFSKIIKGKLAKEGWMFLKN